MNGVAAGKPLQQEIRFGSKLLELSIGKDFGALKEG